MRFAIVPERSRVWIDARSSLHPIRSSTTGLSFRGETRSYDGDMDITVADDNTLRLDGERVFDIREFGMEPPKILMLRVYPEVSVRVSIEATKEA